MVPSPVQLQNQVRYLCEAGWGAETLFLLLSFWQNAQKYTEETAKPHRPLKLTMYLLIEFLKIPHWNENQDCCNHEGSARENTRIFMANRI